MGVSGSGKSLVGALLAEALGLPFYDGDDFHPAENIAKMASGRPLDDHDRKGWLTALNQLALEHRKKGAVIACSALKKQHRALLRAGLGDSMVFIHLNGSYELIKARLEARSAHFMPIGLLQSQFDALEPPLDAVTVSIAQQPREIIDEILMRLR